MALVSSIGAEEKATRFFEQLSAQIRAGTPMLKAALQSQAAVQGPTAEEEYATLMLGDGGDSAADLIPLSGGQSQDTDGRVRFSKSEGTFLHDQALNPDNAYTGTNEDGMEIVAVGDPEALMAASFFTFTNSDGNTHTVGPYFNAFEYGSASAGWNTEITPHSGGNRSRGYPLTPDENPSHNTMSMSKPINARFMYSRFTLDPVAQSVISQILREAIRD